MFITVEIPGGTADLYPSMKVVPPRKRRPFDIVGSQIGRRMEAVMMATRLLVNGRVVSDKSEEKDDDGNPRFTGGDVEITPGELDLMFELNDAVAYAVLHSWTLPTPVPRTMEEFLDIPGEVYDALVVAGTKVFAKTALAEAGFTVDDGAGDLASPTGA